MSIIKTKLAGPQKISIGLNQYQDLYNQSISDPIAFYGEQASTKLVWEKPFSTVMSGSMSDGSSQWFHDGKLNVCANCVDVHLAEKADTVALIWESDSGEETKSLTYQQLHTQVCKFANVLKSLGCQKGDRVCIYMPMILEGAIAMLACARIGAIHTFVFAGFSPSAIRSRIVDADCRFVITADEAVRGGKHIPLKHNVDLAIEGLDSIKKIIVVRHTDQDVTWQLQRDCWYDEEMISASAECSAEPMAAEDPLFILYTSGSTGKPKGVLHSCAGYILNAKLTFEYLFASKKPEVYWCTADLGWITGHTYTVYGPLANGATSLMFEGVPTYPDASRSWQIIDKYEVAVFYTAPTAIRSLMAQGDSYLQQSSRDSLRLLGTVGEAINPEAWDWYYTKVGKSNCPVTDTWWQTETGAVMIASLPGIHDMKPGAACQPFLGVKPVILDGEGVEQDGECSGLLAISQSWPSQIRTVYGDKQRMLDTYFQQYPGYYLTGDGAKRDQDGDIWITGRVDDVINVSGHRIGTAEIESALVLHPAVAEAAVVGFRHNITGDGIHAWVTLIQGFEYTAELKQELVDFIAKTISPIYKPNVLTWAPNLPKTRSGKIMRRILRKLANAEYGDFGDLSTLADINVVKDLIDAVRD